MSDAAEWARTAEQKRPWRHQFFVAFADCIRGMRQVDRVLDLGSGPGFLARHLLQEFPRIEYVALDFSPAMHALARERLGELARRVTFVERSFREADWAQDLGIFDCVVTLQSVHELRHKVHAPALHGQVRRILAKDGAYLVCDHFAGNGGMTNTQLFMTLGEQRSVLREAGFQQVDELLSLGSLALYRAAS
jgi:ubiquinone/menaquinone biosynthesis C-methylase UbiE